MVAVLGDGATWIWQLAAEQFPHAIQILGWVHASERVWELVRALYGPVTKQTTSWVARQLDRVAQGRATTVAPEWQELRCHGETAAVRVLLANDHWPTYDLAA